jgi:hypothetical protein
VTTGSAAVITTGRRLAVAAVIVLLALLGANSAVAGPVPAPSGSIFRDEPDPSGCINSDPQPDCGRRPTASGDPGGMGQLALFAVVGVGLGIIAAVVARSTIRNTRRRAEQGSLAPPTG